MRMPKFDSPLDDALDDFRLAMHELPKHARVHLSNGLNKLTKHVHDLEQRVAALEADN